MKTLIAFLASIALTAPAFCADPAAKPPATTQPKPPASIFDFGGLDPIGPGDVSPKDPKDDPKSKPEKPQPPKAEENPKPAGTAKPPVAPPKALGAPPTLGAPPMTPELAELIKACHVGADGALSVDQTFTFKLRGTEGRNFVVTGEFYPAEGDVLYNSGGLIFHLRELNGKSRYEMGIGGMRAKRTLLEGQKISKFAAPMHFEGVARSTWHKFRVEVAESITAQWDDQKGIAKGPLEMGGGNTIILAPGAKLRNLKVELQP